MNLYENIRNYISEISSNPNLNPADKTLYINVLNKIKLSIPYLTNEKYLEFETKNTIDKLTERINNLTNVFPNDNFPDNLSLEEI